MVELGAGLGSSYPSILDTDSSFEVNSPATGKTIARAEVVNDAIAAVIKVQAELGTEPAGSATDVKTFLQTEHNNDGTHDGSTSVVTKTASQILTNKTLDAPLFTGISGFFAHKNGTNQTGIVTITFTKLTFDTETFDIAGDYANSKYTPNQAGRYLITATAVIELADTKTASLSIYKNGEEIISGGLVAAPSTENLGVKVIGIFDVNGTTDNFEIYIKHDRGVDTVVQGTIKSTYFCGNRL